MIGGTSTGGLIAIMLGRLRMTVDECITTYTSLSHKVFEKKSHRVKINGQFQGRFDTVALEQAVKQILVDNGHSEDTLLKDPYKIACKVYGKPVGLRLPRLPSPIQSPSGPFKSSLSTGLWTQAQDIWGNDRLRSHLRYLVSIGTGVPALRPLRDDVLGIRATLTSLAKKSSLDDEGCYYRFNVARGLEDVGLEESKKQREIAAATGRYVASQDVFRQMKACNACTLFGPRYSLALTQCRPGKQPS
ncbi:hypothetical protein QQZ08_003755 [Neonectria magnoliae]|uniref:PNPLA domain-containing protein n=1 Tax=Neonectria magnoliae TaxID=2732573 RepID=A0ABR1I816_9HYPO